MRKSRTKRIRRRYNKKRTHKKSYKKRRGGVQPTEREQPTERDQPNRREQPNLPTQNINQQQVRDDNWRPPRLDPLLLGINDDNDD